MKHVCIANVLPVVVARDRKVSHVVPALANEVYLFSSSLGNIKPVDRGNSYPKEEMKKSRQQEKKRDVYDRMW